MTGRFSKEFHVLIAVTFFFWTGWLAFAPLFPLFVVEIGASYFELGLLMAIPSLLTIFLRLPVGMSSGRIGRRRILLLALFIQSFAFFLSGLALNTSLLYPVRLLQALALSAFPPVVTAAVSDLVLPEGRGEAFGVFFTSVGLAMICGPFLSSFLISYLTYQLTFLLLSLIPLIGFVLYLQFSGGYQVSRQNFDDGAGKGSFARIIRNRNIQALCVARILFSFTAATFATLFSVYAEQTLLFAPSLISLLFMARGAVNALTRLPSGKLSDRIGRKTPILAGYTTTIFVFLLLAAIRSPLAFVPVMGLYGFAWGMRVPSEAALLSDSLDADDLGLGIAFLQTMFPLGIAMGSIISGVAAQYYSIPTLFQVSSILMIPAAITILMLLKSNRKQ
ncbi:MAG: MFS transporter [Candidatus Bathyarchaeota archaeon]|jgi:predicted MFS family arabinose efflux permease